MGSPLIDLTHVNRIIDEMEVGDFLAKERHLQSVKTRKKQK
jgi:hypothetical protein